MKREKIKKALSTLYAPSTVRSILNGTRKPDYDNMLKLNQLHKIPFTAWADIKSYVHVTTQKKCGKVL